MCYCCTLGPFHPTDVSRSFSVFRLFKMTNKEEDWQDGSCWPSRGSAQVLEGRRAFVDFYYTWRVKTLLHLVTEVKRFPTGSNDFIALRPFVTLCLRHSHSFNTNLVFPRFSVPATWSHPNHEYVLQEPQWWQWQPLCPLVMSMKIRIMSGTESPQASVESPVSVIIDWAHTYVK